jgi:hypothetical protein
MIDVWMNVAVVLVFAGLAAYLSVLPYTTWFDE